MKHKTILELADDYAKAYFMGRGDDARKLLQATIINNETTLEVYYQNEIKRLRDDNLALIIERNALKDEVNRLKEYKIDVDEMVEKTGHLSASVLADNYLLIKNEQK